MTDVSFISSGHNVADARLHRLVRACRRRGLAVEVLALGDSSDGPQGARVRTWGRPTMRARGLLALRIARAASGRVVVAPDPDTLLAAWLLNHARPVGRAARIVADVHENYTDLLRDRSWAGGPIGSAARAVARGAAAVARRADLTMVVDDHIEPLHARERVVVRNDPDLDLIGLPGPQSTHPKAVYVGDTRSSRGLFEMIEVIARSPSWTLDIVGELAAADRDGLAEALTRPELRGRVHVHGRRTPARTWDLVRDAWIGFALLHDTPAFRDAVPSKLFEYLALGIVPVVTDLPRQRALLTEVGSGFVVGRPGRDTVEEAVELLAAIAADPGVLEESRAHALRWRERIERVGTAYELAAERIEALVNR